MIRWVLLAPLLLLAAPVRHLLESRMHTHMLVEFPLLIASGFAWAWMRRRSPVILRWYSHGDAHGITTLVVALAVGAFWMIPAALDLSLLSPWMAAAKYATLWVLGSALADGWRRLRQELRIFVVGNAAWMLATAGLLIQESTQRLCVNYAVDDQVVTGRGLVVAGCLSLLALALPGSKPDRIPQTQPAPGSIRA